MRSYAIGDIHGHTGLLQQAHALVAADKAAHADRDSPIIHVGDLVDRGPDAAGTIEYLRKGVAADENWIVLKGNHDRMFTGFLRDQNHHDPGLRHDLSWLHPRLGGATTLAAYGVRNAADRRIAAVHSEAVAAVPESHLTFLESRPTLFHRGQVLFAHAGIQPGLPFDQQTEDDLTWIREPFLSDRRDHGALVVHGHTALDGIVVHYGNRLNIDSGAAYGGPLTTVVIEGRDVFRLTPAGRIPLAITPDAPVR
jgi:serine/threonine protein phosphatase 1